MRHSSLYLKKKFKIYLTKGRNFCIKSCSDLLVNLLSKVKLQSLIFLYRQMIYMRCLVFYRLLYFIGNFYCRYFINIVTLLIKSKNLHALYYSITLQCCIDFQCNFIYILILHWNSNATPDVNANGYSLNFLLFWSAKHFVSPEKLSRLISFFSSPHWFPQMWNSNYCDYSSQILLANPSRRSLMDTTIDVNQPLTNVHKLL